VSNGSVGRTEEDAGRVELLEDLGEAADRAREPIDPVDQEQVEPLPDGLGERAPQPWPLQGGARHLVAEAAHDPPALLALGIGGESLRLRLERIGR